MLKLIEYLRMTHSERQVKASRKAYAMGIKLDSRSESGMTNYKKHPVKLTPRDKTGFPIGVGNDGIYDVSVSGL